MTSQADIFLIFGIASIGFFSMGFIWGSFKETFWMIEWLKTEHDLAGLQKREPRKRKDVEKGIWRP